MKRSGIIILATTIITLTVFIDNGKSAAQQTERAPSVPVDVNLHYTGKYCIECHEKTPEEGGDTWLKYGGDFGKLCRCHGGAQGEYLHPVGMEPSRGKKERIPADFPLQNRKISCKTCHDIYLQCQESKKITSSVRGAPFKRRSDFCFNCHSEKSFMMQDVHKQIKETGGMITEKCLYCHADIPDVKRETYKDIKLVGNPEEICQGCHVISGNHSGNVNHLIKPTAKGLAKMKRVENEFGIILPLDDDGKITCITCHNPHQKGIIPPENPSANGADSKFRHRLPGKLCQECHKL